MDKMKSLASILREVKSYHPDLGKVALSLANKLVKVYEAENTYARIQKPLNEFLLNAQKYEQTVGFPKNFFVKLYGSVLEFDVEYASVTYEIRQLRWAARKTSVSK